MAERTSGWRRMFSLPAVYRLAQRGIGSPNVRRCLVEEYVHPKNGDRLLDIGCGTGDLRPHLGAVHYVGFDPSEEYVAAATERFGDSDTTFYVAGVGNESFDPGSFDLVVAKGVIHHLDDESARQLFSDARRALRRGGRVVTIDPTFADGQSRIARALAARDRGENVRSPDGYGAIVGDGFDDVTVTTHHDLLRVPYSHAVVTATRS